jgi:hypothetical protein
VEASCCIDSTTGRATFDLSGLDAGRHEVREMTIGPFYVATSVFDQRPGGGWREYVEWSGLSQIRELLSLDGMLCPFLPAEIKDSYWPHIVNEDNLLDFFTDLDFMLAEINNQQQVNVLAVLRNPTLAEVQAFSRPEFSFVGFELLDQDHSVSALTNCGGFPDVFENSEINEFGLITDFNRATEIANNLRRAYPEEHHADCNVWAVFRMIGAGVR